MKNVIIYTPPATAKRTIAKKITDEMSGKVGTVQTCSEILVIDPKSFEKTARENVVVCLGFIDADPREMSKRLPNYSVAQFELFIRQSRDIKAFAEKYNVKYFDLSNAKDLDHVDEIVAFIKSNLT